MDHLLSFAIRFLADVIGQLFFGTLCYWIGWPWVKPVPEPHSPSVS